MFKGLQISSIAFFIFCFSLPTFAQLNSSHGTTVVFLASRDEAVVAADSRRIGSIGRFTLSFDNSCKIAALHNRILYAEAGVSSFACNIAGTSCYWSLMQMTRDLIGNEKSIHAREPALKLAQAWSDRASDALWRYYFLRPRKALIDAPNAPLAAGVFATVGEDGSIRAAIAQLFHDDPYAGPIHIFPRIDELKIPNDGSWAVEISGFSDIADEFLRRDTKRALAERKTWSSSGAPSDMGTIATRLVTLSIRLHPIKKGEPIDVGGPIDAARLTSQGAKWLAKKGNCPD